VVAGLFILLAGLSGVPMYVCMKIGLWILGSAPLLVAVASEISGKAVLFRTRVNLLQPATRGITRKYDPVLFYLIQSLCIGVGVYLLIAISKLTDDELNF